MSDPKRLLTNDDAGALEKEMLASWQSEGPSPEARAKTLAALGLGAGIAASGAVATGSIAPKAMTGVAAILKWATAALLVGAASTAAVVVVRSRSRVEATPATSSVAPSETTPIVAPSTASAVAVTPDVPTVEASSLPVVSPTTTPRVPHKPAAADLGAQIALLDRARASVRSGDYAHALDLVHRYRTDYPNGQLAQEADVVEIEALEKKGDDDAAKAAGRRFLAAHPSSPHAAQVRATAGL